MGALNQEVFVNLLADGNSGFRHELRGVLGTQYDHAPDGVALEAILGMNSINREAALQVYALARDFVAARGYYSYKGLRPWDWDPSSLAALDRSEAWWGFEFETGYNSREDLSTVVRHTWDSYDNVSYDCEGEGRWHSEITFGPKERSKYLDGTADAYKFIEYLSNNPQMVNNTGNTFIGTHLNLSLPDTDYTINGNIAAVLNNTMHMLPGNRADYFGRARLYMGAISHGNYIECKIFRTTYDIEQFKQYVKVADAFTRIATTVAALTTGELYRMYCSNFEELVNNPAAEPVLMRNANLRGSEDGYFVSGDEADDYDDGDDDDDYYDDQDDGEEW